MVTGSSSKEGKVCVWNAMYDIDVIDGKRKQRQKKITNDYEIVDKSTLPSAGDLK